jgi:hypothetical protein
MQARPANEIMKRTIQKLLLPAVGLLLVAASIVQPVAAAGRMPEGQSAWLPPLPAMRRDRRIAPRRNNRLIYRRPEGRHLSRGKPDPAIDFGATKIDCARLLCRSVPENGGGLEWKSEAHSLRPVFRLRGSSIGNPIVFRALRPEQGSRVIPWFIYIALLPMVA